MNTIQITNRTNHAVCRRAACSGCKNCGLVNQQKKPAERNDRKNHSIQLYEAEVQHYYFYYNANNQ